MHPHTLLECLLARRFAVEYQPLVCPVSGDSLGWEALARFSAADGTPLPPDLVFQALHHDPLLLFHTELETKRLQLSLAPPEGLLFVNLDPDSFAAGHGPDGRNAFTELFLPHRQRLVVEVIENLDMGDVALSHQLVEKLKADGVLLAMDDLAASRGLISFAALNDSAYLKFDRSWLADSPERERRTAILSWTLPAARSLGVRTVLEGVETANDLKLARRLGFDLVQGFLFRDRFHYSRRAEA
ncbi:EAL domain-containing protein [Azospira sp. I09]|uniref:EAL domain-containing protein n=1 Tax=Azospira sp. I09 TaxID=1765049 RepID=UPI0012604EF8|nr:EAL domain-containing protein [Azospira sp. I09]BBN90309.1 diguanylate phosphodiesterase [Azospira sp. I09]